MKKLLLVAVVALFSMTSMNAQTFKVGGSVGIGVGDTADAHGLVIGLDAYYYFTDIDALIELGATAGFRSFTGEEDFKNIGYEIPNQSFIPLGLAARVKLFGILSGGADAGYAFGLSDLDGGFYFRPVVSIDIADTIELFGSFEFISNGTDDPFADFPSGNEYDIDYTSVSLGVLFEF